MANIANTSHNFMSEYFTAKSPTINKMIKFNALHVGTYIA